MTILKLPEVIKATALSRSSIYAYAKSNDFPKPILLGKRAVGWLASDIEAWIESRVKTSRTQEDRGQP